MFSVIKKTETFNRRGDVINTATALMFTSSDLVETVKFRYSVDPTGGYCVTKAFAGMEKFVTMFTEHNGVKISFAEMYRIIEGDDAYNAVMDEIAPPVNEKEWIASK